jgi:hypothetical protein
MSVLSFLITNACVIEQYPKSNVNEIMIRTAVCDLLEIEHPIALAGMGSATPHRLLLCVAAHHPAAARIVRNNEAVAELDLGSSAASRCGGAAGRSEGLGGQDTDARRVHVDPGMRHSDPR